MFYRIVKTLYWPIAYLYLGLSVRGDVPAEGPVLLAANHASWLDPPVLGSACPRPVRFLISRRVYVRRSMRWFYRGMKTIPLDDSGRSGPSSIRAAVRSLRRGEVVAIFPEGAGLVASGEMRAPRAGAALIAALGRVPVVPVAIQGTHDCQPKGRYWPRPGRVRVTFGEPFDLPEVLDRDAVADAAGRADRRARRRAGAEILMQRIAALMTGSEGGGNSGGAAA